MSAWHSLIRNSAISKLPRLHTTNNGAQPSRILDTTYLRESRGRLNVDCGVKKRKREKAHVRVSKQAIFEMVEDLKR